jgi:DNA-binding NtrC family response regulator
VIAFEQSPADAERGALVLVVDDEEVLRKYAARVLREAGFGVHEAANGADAVEAIRQGVDPAVVVSDIVMPRMNGVELFQALASERPQLPIILMSGYDTGHLARLGVAAPCGVLRKPFSSDVLLLEVRRCIENPLSRPA